MRVIVSAVGRLKAGPERMLADRYLDRAEKAGRTLGFSFVSREFPEGRAATATARKDQEALAILAAVPAGATLIALDEGGTALDSRTLAERLARFRDRGVVELVFAIGGPDGHGPAVFAKADLKFAFGPMTWPHQLVRIMLAEQLYRAVMILSGHPYHRD